MRRDKRKGRYSAESEAAPLDPVALTLAVWLGLVVAVTGLLRLSEQAAANAQFIREQQSQGVRHMPAGYVARPLSIPFAGTTP